MNLKTQFCAIILFFAVIFSGFPIVHAQQDPNGALVRGYRTGYSDGYLAGYRDSMERAKRNFQNRQEYIDANRVYRPEFGSLEEYRNGYQHGYESGYEMGYEKRDFNAALPKKIGRREISLDSAKNKKSDTLTIPEDSASENQSGANLPAKYQPQILNDSIILIPKDTEIIVEIQSNISTQDSERGDKFMAKVVAPEEIKNTIIEGRVEQVRRPGRVKGNGELGLSFDRIVINEKRWSNFNATVIEALPMRGNNIKGIDQEGTVQVQGSIKSDTVKVSAATGTGAVVGAIAGGPVGAAVGAAVGGAIGIGGVLIMRGKHINLEQGQQLRLRTNYETQIR